MLDNSLVSQGDRRAGTVSTEVTGLAEGLDLLVLS